MKAPTRISKLLLIFSLLLSACNSSSDGVSLERPSASEELQATEALAKTRALVNSGQAIPEEGVDQEFEELITQKVAAHGLEEARTLELNDIIATHFPEDVDSPEDETLFLAFLLSPAFDDYLVERVDIASGLRLNFPNQNLTQKDEAALYYHRQILIANLNALSTKIFFLAFSSDGPVPSTVEDLLPSLQNEIELLSDALNIPAPPAAIEID